MFATATCAFHRKLSVSVMIMIPDITMLNHEKIANKKINLSKLPVKIGLKIASTNSLNNHVTMAEIKKGSKMTNKAANGYIFLIE